MTQLSEPKIYLKNIEKWIPKEVSECASCHRKSICNLLGLASHCLFQINIDECDLSKPGILIIDDNPGIVSFLRDDLEILDEDEKIKLSDYNVFTFSSKNAAYELYATIRRYGNLNIQMAIIDITLGGVIQTLNTTIKLTGIDVFETLLEINPKLKYLFYTGNQMNPYIKPIAEIMKQYKDITGKSISDFIIFKTEMRMTERQDFLYSTFFKDSYK